MQEKNQVAETIFAVIKRLLKWAAIGVVVYWGGLFLLMYVFINVSSSKETVQVKVVNDMNGVSLGESLADVLFKKKEYKRDDDALLFNMVVYGDEKYNVTFSDEKVIVLEDSCKKVFVAEKGVNGIACNDTSEKIKSQYGGDLLVYCNYDNSRIYTSPKHNVIYYLKSNEVKRISVSKNIQKQESWIDCSELRIQ